MIVLTIYEWISLAQWVVMGVTSLLLWRMRTSVKTAVDHADQDRRIRETEQEIERLRKWRHEIIVPWQQTLVGELEERFVTRREWDEARRSNGGSDSPWPTNRRKNPR